ncbi:unnamed protein product (mitochondrion) [Plasmodiophora brassicae]|uniref:GAR domain-containing protein n=1 Tax=Plasmodiophora brassicae TaxID=37360 RepID=A0A0G4IXI2_PLABS|nr:hypothetical protein PBRA_007792 [Plasmodiophora brassicae]SPR00177.1 unnamed protein product [Plasmodiophora brassicae]
MSTPASSSALLFLAGDPTAEPAALTAEEELRREVDELKKALKWTQEKLQAVTTSLNVCEQDRVAALSRVAELEKSRLRVPGSSGQKIGLAQQLEALAQALHSASAEVEANEMELQLERRRRESAKSIADELIHRLTTSDADNTAGGDNVDAHQHHHAAERKPNQVPTVPGRRTQKVSRSNAATVDKAIEHLKSRFQQMNVMIPFVREDDFTYRLGSERLYIQVQSGKLVVRMGGKFIDLLQWLETRY